MGDSSQQETWSPATVLSELFGADRDGAEDLSNEQARESFASLLSDDTPPASAGAYLLGNQWKPNTTGELAAFLDAMSAESVEQYTPIFDAIDGTPPFRGVERTALLGPAVNMVAAAVRTAVATGDWSAQTPSYADHVNVEVLDELGVKTDLSLQQSAAMIDEVQFGLYTNAEYNPGVESLADLRADVGVETPLDVVERFGNPAGADVYVGSYPNQPIPDDLGEICAASESSSFEELYLFDAIEGYDLFDPASGTLVEWVDGKRTETDLDLAAMDVKYTAADLEVDNVPATSAEITTEVLSGERNDNFESAIALNAAIRLYAGGVASSVDEGVTMAREAIADGDAHGKLEDLQNFRSAGTKSVDW